MFGVGKLKRDLGTRRGPHLYEYEQNAFEWLRSLQEHVRQINKDAFDRHLELRNEIALIKEYLGVCFEDVPAQPAKRKVVECSEPKQGRKK